ncbi:MAG: hypothetical protein NUV99_03900 [Clostridia bacterium]|nr:hypothetical protein [Clostridia bacterium]
MPCVLCGGELEIRQVTFTHEQEGKYPVRKVTVPVFDFGGRERV